MTGPEVTAAMKRIRNALRRWAYRRRFARVLRAYGYEPTRQLVDMALDFEADGRVFAIVPEEWRP